MDLSRDSAEGGISLDERAEHAALSRDEAGRLIEDYKAYLHAITRRYAGSSIGAEYDEFHSEAMLAFYEAVQNYDRMKGHFLPFARQIIQRRMIDRLRDLYRAKKNSAAALSFDRAYNTDVESEESCADDEHLIAAASTDRYKREEYSWMLRQEVEQFNIELDEWGITMEDLVEQSPKHSENRMECRAIVNSVCHVNEVLETLFVKRYFPVKAIAQYSNTSPKKIKRFRNYIIAAIIIKNGGYEYMAEYMDN